MKVALDSLVQCFQGVIPSAIATSGLDGEPNVTYLSQVFYVDEGHVALSCQFFNKTRRNVAENPYASVVVNDPLTFDAWRLRLRFDHAETEGPLFETMAERIQVIASHTGMAGVFRLISADVYEVLAVEPVEGFLLPPDAMLDAAAPAPATGPLTELRGLQAVSERIARAGTLDELLGTTLATLDELLGFSHAMIFLAGGSGGRLRAAARRGYGDGAPAVEVEPGCGLVGTVAERRRVIRVTGVGESLRYGRAVRGRVQECGEAARLGPEVPLAGLVDAQAQLALPLVARDELVGVLFVESRDPLCFDDWDEAFLHIVGSQIATAIDRIRATTAPTAAAGPTPKRGRRKGRAPGEACTHRFVFYRNDDCVFVDDAYLVRNVPGKILWKLLTLHAREGRTQFTNRELRLDPSLGLPPIKDNLESRLILLRKRLAERCPDVRLASVGRGRFALELDCRVELEERDSA